MDKPNKVQVTCDTEVFALFLRTFGRTTRVNRRADYTDVSEEVQDQASKIYNIFAAELEEMGIYVGRGEKP